MLAKKYWKSLLTLGICWTTASAILCYYTFPDFVLWSLIFPFIFFAFLAGKWKLLTSSIKEELKSPMLYLSLQGTFFLLALVLIAVIMLGFREDKKILLPILLLNYLVFLVFDLVQMLRQKPLS